jgi:hypothetical protein
MQSLFWRVPPVMHIATGSRWRPALRYIPLELMRLRCVFYRLGNVLTRALVGFMLRSLFPVGYSQSALKP